METEADLIKQSCWTESEAVEAGKAVRNYRGTTVTACNVSQSVKTKILATLRKAGEYIYSSEILRTAKFRDCLSKVRVKIRS